jgi:hypothetical protein
MSESAQTPNDAPTASKAPSSAARSKFGRRPAIVAAVGVLLVVAAVGLVLEKADIGMISGDPAQPTVSFVAQRDIGAAATTLTPSAAAALVEDAERCRVPLVSMSLARGSAALGSTIRIRAGSYVSPYFTVTDSVQRIAVPYPAPYGSGAGDLHDRRHRHRRDPRYDAGTGPDTPSRCSKHSRGVACREPLLGACLRSHWSSCVESDSLHSHEQALSSLEDR